MAYSISDWFLTHHFMWKEFDTKKSLSFKKRIENKEGAKRAIIFYPYWTGNSKIYNSFSRKFSDSTLVFYDYPNEVMSEDVNVSLKYINQVLSDSLNTIKKLRKEGVEEIVLVGSSFGSNIAFKLSTLIKVEKVVLNMLDRNIAKTIFKSPALKILRKKLKRNGFTLHKLDKVYKFISIDNHLKNIKSKKTEFLFLLSRTDIFTPYKVLKPTLDKMNSLGIDYKLKINNLMGHILSIYWNLWFSNRINDFIED